MKLIHLKEGLRMYRRARAVEKNGFTVRNGTPEQICKDIISDCFDKEKKYFRVSTGHFCEFYVRDFAFTCEALLALGHKEDVKSTLQYALSTFVKAGKVTTSISPDGKAFDFPGYAPDSLALLLYAITHTNNEQLIDPLTKGFLQREAIYFAQQVIDKKTLLPKEKKFSSIRDHAKRKGSCYDAVMCAVVARECKALRLTFPYEESELTAHLIKAYWNGTYFFEDLRVQPVVVGDANVFPFWTGIITDKKMLDEALTAMRAAELDKPFPLRYVSTADSKQEKIGLHVANLFASDYETDSIWMHLGLCYLRVVGMHDKKLLASYLQQYEALITKHKTFLELYDRNGEPFRTTWYVADESMVWCANWLALKK